MTDKKTIIEEAVLDFNNIQKTLTSNAKEILRSVAREEINGLVKESMMDEVYEEEDDDEEMEQPEMDSEDSTELDLDSEDLVDDEFGDIDNSLEGPEMDADLGMDTDVLGGEEMDMTGAEDDEIIAIYKKLNGDDEIEIVGDEIHLNINEPGQYVVKMDGMNSPKPDMGMDTDSMDIDSMEMDTDSMEMDDEDSLELEDGEDDEEVEYEIEMEDDVESDESDDFMPADEEEEEEEEEEEPINEKISIGTGMSVGNNRNKTGPGSIGAPENPKSINEASKALVSKTIKKYNALLTEAKKLKSENEQFRVVLKDFRNKLVETVIFNSNLASVSNLFVEHSTTKGEKENIMKRFDDVKSIKESKQLFKTIGNELERRKPISESIGNKFSKDASTGSSKQLNESTAYVDPSTTRIIELMRRVENKNKY
jgi:hypothetical protein